MKGRMKRLVFAFFACFAVFVISTTHVHASLLSCTKVYTSCNNNCSPSGGVCPSDCCSNVANSSVVSTTSITGGSRITECTGYYTGGTYPNGCTGCTTTNTYCSCNSGYAPSGSGSSCTCQATCSTSKSCATDFPGYTGTYNECTQNQSTACSKSCSSYTSGGYNYNPVASTVKYPNDCSYTQGSCVTSCTSVSNTETASCTPSASHASAGTKQCIGNYTSSGCSSAGDSCSGCSNWSACVVTACESGYRLDGNGGCELDCSTSASCPGSYHGTYNECTGNMSTCYTYCYEECTINDTASCPAHATCTYDTTSRGRQYYGSSSCSAGSYCAVIDFECDTGYRKSGNSCVACSTSRSCASDFSGYSGTYNQCTQNQSTQCYKTCSSSTTCSGNETSLCPENANCTYDTTYTATDYGTQYYGGSCSAVKPAAPTCPFTGYTCAFGYADIDGECVELNCSVGQYINVDTCAACTNLPAHAHYTGLGSTATNCPWECDEDWTLSNGQCVSPVGGDICIGSDCSPAKFAMTLSVAANNTRYFDINATGVFYIDWGDGTVEKKNFTSTSNTISHKYTSKGTPVVRIGGTATGYNTSTTTATFEPGYSSDRTSITGIYGSLGQVFPTLSNSASGQPKFYETFKNCSNITSKIPAALFDGVTGGVQNMFQSTFDGCSGLTGSIPGTLFSGITTAQTNMFQYTFENCSNLESFIPPELFLNLEGQTASSLMYRTFYKSSIATSCPTGYTQYTTGFESDWTYSASNGGAKVSCRLECGENQIPAGLSECVDAKFSMTYDSTYRIETDMFSISASGVFYVDWGDGSYEKIDRTGNTTKTTYTHKYSTNGTYTIKMAGLATGYNSSDTIAAFSLYDADYKTSYKGIYGSLGAIFPTLSTGTPSFYYTFEACSNLASTIPPNLFSGVTGGRARMFEETFYGCSKLTGSIPGTLFSGIDTVGNRMFYNTFYNCSKLESFIPPALFKKIEGQTASNLMYGIFASSGIVTQCPTGYAQYITGFESSWSSKVSCEPGCNQITLNPGTGGTAGSVTKLYKRTDSSTWYTDSMCTNIYSTNSNIIPTRNGYTFRGFFSASQSDVTSDNNAGTVYLTHAGAISDDGAAWTTNANTTLYAAWAKNCTEPQNGLCLLQIVTPGIADYTTSCNTGYTISGNNTATPTCAAKCNAITLNNASNGGSANTTVYKKTNSALWYSNNACSTQITTITAPTKTNGTYGGHYTAATNGTQYIDESGALSTTWTVTAPATLWAQYDCKQHYQTNGVRISGACAANVYNITLYKNTSDTDTETVTTIYEKYGTGVYTNSGLTTAVTTSSNNVTKPTRTGTNTTYVFNGYWTARSGGTQMINANGSLTSSFTNTTITSATSLFAQWKMTCAAGNYLPANTQVCASCPAGYYCAGGTFSPSTSIQGRTGVCASGYSTGGASASTCTACATGYSASGTAATNHDESTDCKATVTLNKNGGIGTANTTVTCTQGVSCNFGSTSLLQTGYTFTGGWGTSTTCTGNQTSFTNPSGTYYACKTANCNAITLNPNNGTAGSVATLYKKSGATTWYRDSTCTTTWTSGSNVIPTRSGYKFRGFYDSQKADITATTTNGANRHITHEGATTNTGTNWTITGAATLYAGWARECATVTGGSCSVTIAQNVTYTTSCNTGYTMSSGSGTYNPVCTANDYTITLNNASATTAGTATLYTTYNTNVYLNSGRTTVMTTSTNKITVPAKTGYTFAGYYSASNGGTQYIASNGFITTDGISAGKLTADSSTWYAHWTATTSAVTLNANSGTNGSTTSVTATYGSSMPQIATANLPTRAGYSFAGFFDTSAATGGTQYYAADGVSARSWNKTGAQTLWARWSANAYTVTLDKNASDATAGTGSVSPVYGAAMPTTQPNLLDTAIVKTKGCTASSGEYPYSDSGTAFYNVFIRVQPNTTYTYTTTTKGTRQGIYEYNSVVNPDLYTTSKKLSPTRVIKAGGSAGLTTDTFTTGSDAKMVMLYLGNQSTQPVGLKIFQQGQVSDTAITMPTRTDYTFAGYYDTSAATGGNMYYKADGTSNQNWNKSDNTTLYARWTPNTCTVTFKTGNTSMGTQDFPYTGSQALTAVASLSNAPVSGNGWSFHGWSKTVNTTTATYTDGQSISDMCANGDVTLYGIWKRTIPFKYYNSATATSVTTTNGTQYYRNTSATAASASSVATYALYTSTQASSNWAPLGWATSTTATTASVAQTGATTTTVTPSATAAAPTYYAVYSRTPSVSYNANGGTGTTAATDCAAQTYNAGGTTGANASCTLASNGFTKPTHASAFSKWADGSTSGTQYAAGASYTFANKAWNTAASRTMYAKWTCATGYNGESCATANTCTVTFKTGNTSMGTEDFTYGTAKTLTAVASLSNAPVSGNGWSFHGWATAVNSTTANYTDGQSVNNLCTTNGGAITLYGVWKRTIPFKYYNSATATSVTTTNGTQYYRNTSATAASASSVATYALYTSTQASSNWAPLGWATSTTATTASVAQTGATTTTVTPSATAAAPTYYAVYSRTPSVSYNANGGTGTTAATDCAAQTYNAGGTTGANASCTLASNGFTKPTHASAFSKWADGSTSGTQYAAGASYTFANKAWNTAASRTMYAKWTCAAGYSGESCATANTYTVTLNANGGTAGTTTSVTATYGSAMPVPTNNTHIPTRAGYTFAGFYDTDATTGGNMYYKATGASNKNWDKTAATTLYARWTQCAANSYCPGDNTTVTCSSQSSVYTKSDAGADSVNDCYFLTTAGKYLAQSTSTTETTCPAFYYCPATKIYYGNVGSTDNADTVVDGVYNCPAISSSTTMASSEYPDWFYNVTSVTPTNYNGTGVKAKTSCRIYYTVVNERGTQTTLFYFNSTSGKYNTYNQKYYTKYNPGYYGNEYHSSSAYCDVATRRMYHQDAQPCPAGSYCPGLTSIPYCNNTDYTWAETIGIYDCPTAYPNSAAQSSKIGQCYLTTTAKKYVATAGAGEVDCVAGGYCPGSVTVYYNTDGGTATGGRTTCPANSYCGAKVSTHTLCNTLGGKLYTKSAAGSDSVTDCYATIAATKYLPAQSSTAVSNCTAGNYCPGGDFHYSSTATNQGLTACTAPYSSSAASSDDANDCYLTTTAKKYVATAGAGEVDCVKGNYCPGGSVIYKGGSVSGRNTTGGSTTCPANSYCVAKSSAATACNTLGGGLYTKSAAGSDAATDCYATIAATKYLPAQSSTAVSNCTAGNYCPGGDFHYSSTATNQGLTACTAPYSSSAASSDDANDCYLTTTAAKYVATAGAGEVDCVKGNYCPGGSVIYKGGSVSGRSTTGGSTTCPANSYCVAKSSAATACSTLGGGLYTKSAAGSDADTDCYITTTAGKYLAASTDTAQTTCPAFYYCPATNVYYPNAGATDNADTVADGIYNCPAISSSTTMASSAYPDWFYNVTSVTTSAYTGTGVKAKTSCRIYYYVTNERGNQTTAFYYNSTSGKYDTFLSKYYTKFNAGYYGVTKYTENRCSTSSNTMIYQDAQPCPAGSFCPALNSMPKCSTGDYNDEMNRYECAAGSYSAAGASTCTACPGGRTTSGAGTAYNTNANTTCSVTCSSIANLATWATPSWSSSGTTPNVTNSVSGLCTVDTCVAGAYKSGNTCPVCGASKWSDAGATSCTACTTGYANTGDTASSHAGQSSCKATVTLNKNSGSGSLTTNKGTFTGTNAATIECSEGASCTFPSASGLTQTGYTFKTGWGTSSSCTATTTSFTNPTGTYYACKTANNYEITLNKNGGTADGTTKIYTTYNTNVYNDSARTKAMTASANPIATAPSKTYTVSYNGNNGTVGTTAAANTTSSATFNGFFSATSGGTKYIESNKYINTNGISAAKTSTGSTWYAQWGTQPTVTLPTATRTNYTLRGWYTAAQTDLTASGGSGTLRGAAGGTYTPSASETLYAAWARNCTEPAHGTCSLTINSDGTATYSASCDAGYTVGSATTANPTCTANTLTISLNKNGGTGTCGGVSGTNAGSQTCTYDAACTTPTWNSTTCNITNGSGTSQKVLTGWNTKSDGTGTAYGLNANIKNIISSGTTTLYAVWETPVCTITNGSGTSTVTNNTPTCAVTCTNGYSQSGYTNTTTTFNKAGTANNKTVTASCAARTYKVTLDPKRYTSASDTTGTAATTNGTVEVWYHYKTKSPCWYYSKELKSAADEVTANCIAGTTGSAITNPTLTGYTFGGYYTTKPGTGTQYVTNGGVFTNSIYSNVASDSTLYAKWTANTLTISLNKNGGTGTCGGVSGTNAGSQTCTYDAACTTPTWNSTTCNITNGSGTSQKVLTGWNTKSDGTGTAYGLNASIKNIISSGTTTLYAVWETPVCTITNGSGTSTVTNNTPTCAVTCTNGYSQSGYTNTTTTFNKAGTANNKTVTASCAARTYKVTLDPKRYTSASDTTGTAATTAGTTAYWYVFNSASPSYFYNKEITSASDMTTANQLGSNGYTITKPTLTGYTFGGYFVGKTGTGNQYMSNAGSGINNLWSNTGTDGRKDITLYAKWTAKTNTITLNGNDADGGKIRNTAMTSGAVTFTCTTNSSISLPTWNATDSATTTSIYKGKKRFLGWATSQNATAAETITTCPTGNKTYYAVWSADCSCGNDSNATCDVQNTSNNTCQYKHTCTTGYYNTNNGKTVTSNTMTCTACPAGSFCAAGATTTTLCAAGSYTSTTGQSACTACQNGTTNTGADATSQQSCGTTCSNAANVRANDSTGWTTATWANNSVTNACTIKTTGCAAKYYYNSNACSACPTGAAYKRDASSPAEYYATSVSNPSIISGAGASSISGCKASMTITSTRGILIDQATYNTTTNKYDISTWHGWYKVNAGYYLTTKGSCGTYAYYQTANVCPEGSYCPGKDGVVCNSSNQATVHTTNFGLESCPTNYPNSAEGSSKIGQCYLTTTAKKYVATAGAGEVDCTAGGYCPGNVTVYYNADGGAETGGRTTCPANSYCGAKVSTHTLCNTLGGKLYTKSAAGSDAATDCYATIAATKYLPAQSSTSVSNCTAGNYCPGGNFYYSSTATNQGLTACTAPYSNSATSSDDANDCYLTTTAAKYVATAGAGETDCVKGNYCPGGSVIYKGGSVSGRSTTGGSTQCPANSYCVAKSSAATACNTLGGGLYTKSAAGSDADTDCYITTTAGKYLAASTDTAQTTCPAKKYCVATTLNYPNVNAPADCPTANASTARTTYPDDFYNPTRVSISNQNWSTGITSINGCLANYTFTNARGNFVTESVKYNSTSGKYDGSDGTKYYTALKAGYYGSDRLYNGTTYCGPTDSSHPMYYREALPCPEGSYCPALNAMPKCNTGTYEDTINIYACAAPYSSSAALSDDENDCYLTTTSGKYVAEVGAGEVTCACGGYCPGNVTVYKGGSVSGRATTGGRTACGSGKYNASTGSSASSACSTAAAGYYANSSCSATICPAGTYATAGAASCSNINAGYYSTGGGTSATPTANGNGCTGSGNTCGKINSGYYCSVGAKKATPASASDSVSSTSSCGACNALTGVSPSGGTYTSVAGSTANTACKYTAPSKTINGCKTVTSQEVTYSGTAWPASTYAVTASKGYVIANNNKSNATCTQCTSGGYQAVDGSTATSCSLCSALTAPSVTGGTFSSVSPYNAATTCRYKPADITKPANCATVTTNTVSYSGSAWGTGFYTVTANTGYTAHNSPSATPTCDANCNAITLNANNGTSGSVTTLYKLTDATGWFSDDACTTDYSTNANTKATRSGYTLRGWYTTQEADITANATTPTRYLMDTGATTTTGTAWTVKAPATLYAAWATNCAAGTGANCSLAISGNNTTYTTSCKGGYGTLVNGGKYNPSCTQCAAGTASANGNNTCSTCANWTYSAKGASSCTSCPTLDTGYSKADSTSTGWTAYTQCVEVSDASPTNCASGNLKKTATSSTAWGSAAVNTELTANANYYVNGTACSACSGLASGFYPNSAAGNTGGASACYTNTLSGKVVATENATSATDCVAGTYKAEHTVNYGDTSSCSNCEGRTKFSAAGAASCSTVTSGYYTTGCTGNNNCTAQSQCTGSTYCVNGVQNNCPTAESTWTQGTGTGWSAVTQCFETKDATAVSSNCTAGQLKKNATNATTWGSSTINTALKAKAGAYVSGQTCKTCSGATYQPDDNSTATSCTTCPTATVYADRVTSYAYYSQDGVHDNVYGCRAIITEQDPTGDYNLSCGMGTDGDYGTGSTSNTACMAGHITSCAAGRYAPYDNPSANVKWAASVTAMEGIVCVESGSGYYSADEELERHECPENYPNSAVESSVIGQCYLTTDATKYVATAGAGEVDCVKGGYCPGGTNVYYNTDGGITTGGRTGCPQNSYCVAKVSEPTACASPYTKSAAGSDDANDCYLTTTAKKYVATAGAGETTCVAGGYCAGGTTVYRGGTVSGRATTGGIAVCATDKYSDAGASVCTACGTANGYHNSGSTYANHAGVKSCVTTCDGGTYVSVSGGKCGNVGAGYYMAAHTVKQTETDVSARGQCPTGLTTIGYGTGADDAGDCGRKFHAADGMLYLRSTKRTTPSLNVKIDGVTYYGNMSTVERNMSAGTTRKLKVRTDDKTYHVYDDSVGGESEVPNEYTPVEYIQSNGNQVIDTGIIMSNTNEVQSKFKSTTASKYLYGCVSSNNAKSFTAYVSSAGNWRFGNQTIAIPLSNNVIYDTVHNSTGVTVNGTSAGTYGSTTFTTPCSLALFGSTSTTGTVSPNFAGSVYYVRIYDNNKIMFNGIPVKRTSDNVCGLYDTVTKTFFGSASSTAFTCP